MKYKKNTSFASCFEKESGYPLSEYLAQELPHATYEEIGIKLGISKHTVRKRAQEYGLTKNPNKSNDNEINSFEPDILSKEWLAREFLIELLDELAALREGEK
ncbi:MULTISPECIES: hypothetical protein [Cysteiniphilum]|uniref:Uncharacterized protein n=1 Tax=Cysteiniphilum litorale TaxID=2056700 RepID=A0A8J2Z2M7_9GAMM|nr:MULTISPECIES: hypothetical protein [Cysteiniphilum]GGF91179.1 hypothetical protein GCM10010995_05580 [Cysteiniphilum litorale]